MSKKVLSGRGDFLWDRLLKLVILLNSIMREAL